MSEADVPRDKPNIAERATVAEDYIQTSTWMIKGDGEARNCAKTAAVLSPGNPNRVIIRFPV